jgi:hypothetical protein
MKTIITILLTFVVLAANAQTNDTSSPAASTNQVPTKELADLKVSIPMIGIITLENCDANLQDQLNPLTLMTLIKPTDSVVPAQGQPEETIVEAYDALKEIPMPLQ